MEERNGIVWVGRRHGGRRGRRRGKAGSAGGGRGGGGDRGGGVSGEGSRVGGNRGKILTGENVLGGIDKLWWTWMLSVGGGRGDGCEERCGTSEC